MIFIVFLEMIYVFAKKLNAFYKNTPALWQTDFSWEGFEWIVSDDNSNSVIAFRRKDKQGKEIITACNFTNVRRESYRIGVPVAGTYEVIFNSDDKDFGGDGATDKKIIRSEPIPMHSQANSIDLDLAGLSAVYTKLKRKNPTRKNGKTKKED